VQKPILIEDYSNLYSVNGKALSSGGIGCALMPAPPILAPYTLPRVAMGVPKYH
jgi:hypothetical protein